MDEFEKIVRSIALQQEIIKRYEAGERNFANTDLRCISISYPSLIDIDFSAANLEGSYFGSAYFVNANLSSANLHGSRIYGSLINSNLIDANLRRVKLIGADLIGSNLTGADLTEADLSGAVLINVNLMATNLTGIKTDERTIFISTIMPDGSTRNNSIKQIINAQKLRQRFYIGWENDFQDIIMHNADLSGIDLHGVNMSGAYFSCVSFRDANLSRADLSKVRFIGCDLRETYLGGAKLEGSKFIFCKGDFERWFGDMT
jgi:uncharacterized protein YjbI with pentapeptide repeats